MLEPLAVDPKRSVAPAANSIASARLVFPAPAGPTSAITRVPLDGCPAMRLSLRAVTGARVALRKALGRHLETSTVRLFSAVGKGARYGSDEFRRGTGAHRLRFFAPWSIQRDIRRTRRRRCRSARGRTFSREPTSGHG